MPWVCHKGTSGYDSTIAEPSRYSGNCGPGTLVTVMLKGRTPLANRLAMETSVAGAPAESRTNVEAPKA